MSGSELIKNEDIQNRIYTLRDVQVMLDKDLAIFYGVKPIRLREQVKRNIKRFPSDFMFQLTEEEVDYMVSQNAIPSKQHLGVHSHLFFLNKGLRQFQRYSPVKERLKLISRLCGLLLRCAVLSHQMRKFFNVWCRTCSDITGIGSVSGKVENLPC